MGYIRDIRVTKKTVDQYLNEVDYKNEENYIPSDFSLEFVNFIKLVNGSTGEENKTPIIHYKMLDQIAGKKKSIANMLFRGASKTTIFGEYLFLYLAVYGSIPGFGEVNLALYVSDSIENGVKNMRKNLEYRWENSDFLKRYIVETKFTDIRWEFKNSSGKTLVVKGYGASALALDTRLYTKEGYTTIKECCLGQQIYGPNGILATITDKSEVFNKPMWKLLLEDGRYLKVSEDHINSVEINTNPNNTARWEAIDITTKDLLKQKFIHTKVGNKRHKGISRKCLVRIKNIDAIEYTDKELPIDPYTLGLILGDGSVKNKGSGIVVTGLQIDTDVYRKHIPYSLGEDYLDKRSNSNIATFSIKGVNQQIRDLKLDVHGDFKFIPECYYFGSIKQRLDLLQGLMDTDGTISSLSRMVFVSSSKQLVEDVARLTRSLGGRATISTYKTVARIISKNSKMSPGGKDAFKVEIWINMNPFKLERKASKFIFNNRKWNYVNVIGLEFMPSEPSQCIAIDSEDHQYVAGDYVRTHNTGVRGSKEMGQRPVLAVLDDLVKDEDARSKTVMASIEDTVYKAVNYALHPTRNKIIFSGTPFNANDILYKAVESGAWHVNVFPVCEEFPCTREEFKGAWEDRFTYDYVKAEYDKAIATGQIHSFNQELMLRIMSEDDRVILDGDIVWYKRENVVKNKGLFNFYITTDFATSSTNSADYSFISVWAYNNNGDWLWVDGLCERQLMDKNVDALFRYAQKYKPQSVGIEVSGQQGGFIPWIMNEMVLRNIYFPIASEGNNNKPGIRPVTNKMQRFNVVVPWFKMKKIWFPEEYKNDKAIVELVQELSLVTPTEFKSKHDDGIDTVSQLGLLRPFKPSQEVPKPSEDSDPFWEEMETDSKGCLNSYVV